MQSKKELIRIPISKRDEGNISKEAVVMYVKNYFRNLYDETEENNEIPWSNEPTSAS